MATKKRSFCASVLLLLAAAIPFFLLPPFVQVAYSDGFKLTKVDSRHEPELKEKPAIALPNSNIQAGTYIYIRGADQLGRIGFLTGMNKFYFVDSNHYSLIGETNRGVYKNYFVMDAWGYGGGHSRLMFLFRWDKDSVQLLDVIGQAYVNNRGMDFVSEYEKSALCDIYRCPPRPMVIKNVDQDGNPEIKLFVSIGNKFEPLDFELYLEIAENRLRVDLNHALYEPLFKQFERKSRNSTTKPVEYYIYGFLAKKLDIDAFMKGLKGRSQYDDVVIRFENLAKWDAAFHEVGGEVFHLKQYDLTRR